MRSIVLGLLISAPAFLGAADQPFDVKPGLWIFATNIQTSGSPPIPNLDKMSPEQRARIEGAMKNMSGTPMTNSVKSCVTKAGIDKAVARASSTNGNRCDPKITSITASRVDLHMDCDSAQGQGRSKADLTINKLDSEHIKGDGSITSAFGARTMDMKWSMTGNYVSSDCGDLKPDDGQ